MDINVLVTGRIFVFFMMSIIVDAHLENLMPLC